MRDLLLALLHLAVTAAKLCRRGGVRAVITENLLLKQQLIVLRRARQRAPNLKVGDRLLCGFGSLFLSPGRIRKVAIGVRPATLLTFHQALVRRKYRRLFSSSPRAKKPGPKGPSEALIRAIVGLKARNPRFGCPRPVLGGWSFVGECEILIEGLLQHATRRSLLTLLAARSDDLHPRAGVEPTTPRGLGRTDPRPPRHPP